MNDAEFKKLEKDIALLDKSILHWQGIVQGYEAPTMSGCSLCQEYFDRNNFDICGTCPIQEVTGYPQCRGTPYQAAYAEYKNQHKHHKATTNFHRVSMLQWLKQLRACLDKKLRAEITLKERLQGAEDSCAAKVVPVTKPSINWEHVSSAFQYLATDRDGYTWLYSHRPRFCAEAGRWLLQEGSVCNAANFASFRTGACIWKDSLTQRPEMLGNHEC